MSFPGPFYSESVAVVAERLDTDGASGLSPEHAARLLAEIGPNELQRVGTRTWYSVLFTQFTDFLAIDFTGNN